MKAYLLLSCLSVLFLAPPCVAQEVPEIPAHVLDGAPLPPHMNDDNHKPPKDFAKELGLTEEQQKRSEELHKKMREEMAPIKEEIKKLREKARELRQEHRKAFEALLTEEQKEKLKQMKPPHKEGKFRHHHHKKRGFFPHNPE